MISRKLLCIIISIATLAALMNQALAYQIWLFTAWNYAYTQSPTCPIPISTFSCWPTGRPPLRISVSPSNGGTILDTNYSGPMRIAFSCADTGWLLWTSPGGLASQTGSVQEDAFLTYRMLSGTGGWVRVFLQQYQSPNPSGTPYSMWTETWGSNQVGTAWTATQVDLGLPDSLTSPSGSTFSWISGDYYRTTVIIMAGAFGGSPTADTYLLGRFDDIIWKFDQDPSTLSVLQPASGPQIYLIRFWDQVEPMSRSTEQGLP